MYSSTIKFNTWRSKILNDPTRDATDKALSKIHRITRNLHEEIPKVFDDFCKAPSITILSVAPNKKTLQLVLHHVGVVGGSILSPDVTYTALSGFDSEAIPVKFDTTEPFSHVVQKKHHGKTF